MKKLCAVAACALVLAPVASASSGWAPTGSMTTGRGAAQAVSLDGGRVLVAGGFSGSGEVAGSEIYDPATGTWSATGSLLAGRHYASLTRLADGRVLIAGGFAAGGVTASAELYDPATGTWSATGSMAAARDGHGATLLADGTVLVAGGEGPGHASIATAELYDPATGTWSATGSMAAPRENHVQVLLPGGRVLVAGGYYPAPSLTFLASAEVYDPVAHTWSPTGSMATARAQMTSVALGDGTVLAAGGVNNTGFLMSAERYDPVGGSWSAAGSVGGQSNVHLGAALPDGRALVVDAGGGTNAVLFAPGAAASHPAGTTSAARFLPTVNALPGGRVLVAGGAVGATRVTTAEVWTPSATRTAADADFGSLRDGGTAERDLAVTNTGSLSLWVDGVALAGPDAGAFAVVADGCGGRQVAAGASCTVRVRFTAAGAAGARAARLDLDDNADGAAGPALSGTVEAAPTPPDPDPDPTPDPPAPPAPNPPTPVPPVVTTPAPAPKPASPPAACSSRRKFTMSKSLTRSIRSGTAKLNGKVIARLSPRHRTITVDLRGRRAGTYTLRVTIHTKKGRTVKLTRKYKTCAPRG